MQCKSWLKATVQKLCHKTAVQYQLARNLQFLDPRNIGDKDLNCTRLKAVLQLLVHSNRVSESVVDEILREHSIYVDHDIYLRVAFDFVNLLMLIVHVWITSFFAYSAIILT